MNTCYLLFALSVKFCIMLPSIDQAIRRGSLICCTQCNLKPEEKPGAKPFNQHHSNLWMMHCIAFIKSQIKYEPKILILVKRLVYDYQTSNVIVNVFKIPLSFYCQGKGTNALHPHPHLFIKCKWLVTV